MTRIKTTGINKENFKTKETTPNKKNSKTVKNLTKTKKEQKALSIINTSKFLTKEKLANKIRDLFDWSTFDLLLIKPFNDLANRFVKCLSTINKKHNADEKYTPGDFIKSEFYSKTSSLDLKRKEISTHE